MYTLHARTKFNDIQIKYISPSWRAAALYKRATIHTRQRFHPGAVSKTSDGGGKKCIIYGEGMNYGRRNCERQDCKPAIVDLCMAACCVCVCVMANIWQYGVQKPKTYV